MISPLIIYLKVYQIIKNRQQILKERYLELAQRYYEDVQINQNIKEKNSELKKLLYSRTDALNKKIRNVNGTYNRNGGLNFNENLTGIIAHEIKNNLTSIMLVFDKLSKDELIEDNKRYLFQLFQFCTRKLRNVELPLIVKKVEQINDNYYKINSKLNHMSIILNSNLELCRNILSNYIAEECIKDDIKILLNNIKNKYKSLCKKNKINFKMAINWNPHIYFSKSDLVILLKNMFENSLNSFPGFDKKGKKMITIDIAIKNTKLLLIKIEDNGCGVPDNLQQKIFKPFTASNLKRFGIGLTYCKKIVEKYRGTILFKSKLNKGTTLSFLIPLKQEIKS